MSRFAKIVFSCLISGVLCGCVFNTQSNTPTNNPVNVNTGVSNTTTSQLSSHTEKSGPNIYIKGLYNAWDKTYSGSHLDHSPGVIFDVMPAFVYEFNEDSYLMLNNSVYKNSNGNIELLFDSYPNIKSLVGVTDSYIVYLSEEKEEGNEIKRDSVWKYNTDTKEITRVFDESFTDYRLIMNGNDLFVRELFCLNSNVEKVNIVYADIENNTGVSIPNYTELTEEEMNKLLPEEYKIKKYKGLNVAYDEYEIYKTPDGGKIVKIGLAPEVIDDEFLKFYSNDSFYYKWMKYQDSVYYIRVYANFNKTDYDPRQRVPFGTEEICDTKNWIADEVSYEKIDSKEMIKNETQIYSDDKNRILGYNPRTNEAYIYVFENGTITIKNLNSDSETIIETLESAQTIRFEWCDTRFCCVYEKDGKEEYGGMHEFGK